MAIPVCGIFLTADLVFFAANLLKIAQGGWIPLTFGAIVFVFLTTWHEGIDVVRQKLDAMTESASEFFARLSKDKIPRVPGTGVFLTRMADSMPPPIIDHVLQVGALYETLLALTIVFEEIPRVHSTKRIEVLHLFENFWHITIHYGFMEIPDLPTVLREARDMGSPWI